MKSCSAFACSLFVLLISGLSAPAAAAAQQAEAVPVQPAPPATPQPVQPTAAAADPPSGPLERLIYVPFRELQKVFNNPDASVILPYSEYLQLLQKALENAPRTTANEDAVITSSSWSAVVEKDIVRISAELQINVLRQEGWAALPVTFGAAAIGRVEPADGSVLLKGLAEIGRAHV